MVWKKVLTGSTAQAIMHPADSAVLSRAIRRSLLPTRGTSIELERNLTAAYRWLCSAQDATPDGGVAGLYNLFKGWGASYPETTGYIIPTFLHYAETFNEPEARDRAIRMADWESDVQLDSGAVRSGMLDVKVGPAVFNTGQVLFGWVSAWGATGNERYSRSAAAASHWLVKVQSEDGAWRKNLSVLTSSSVQTYNARAAWGLALAGHEFDEPRWENAALKNCDWVLAQQKDNGWFGSNAFSDNEDPLLHTIGYVLEGVLGIAELFHREEYVHSVRRGVEPLLRIYQRTGSLKGRYNQQWRPTVYWRCLTGEAQIALVLLRLTRVTGEKRYEEIARPILENVARLQDTESSHTQSHGGVTGSHPAWGGYGPFNYLNWAAKFFMDALLLHLQGVDVQHQPARPSYIAARDLDLKMA